MKSKLDSFLLHHRVFLVKHFYQFNGDTLCVKFKYETKYKNCKESPNFSCDILVEIIKLFEKTGSVFKNQEEIEETEECQEIEQIYVKPENPEQDFEDSIQEDSEICSVSISKPQILSNYHEEFETERVLEESQEKSQWCDTYDNNFDLDLKSNLKRKHMGDPDHDYLESGEGSSTSTGLKPAKARKKIFTGKGRDLQSDFVTNSQSDNLTSEQISSCGITSQFHPYIKVEKMDNVFELALPVQQPISETQTFPTYNDYDYRCSQNAVKFFSFLEQKFNIPTYLKNVLHFCGYGNVLTLSTLNSSKFPEIERTVQNDMAMICDRTSEYFGCYSSYPEKFRIPEGYKGQLLTMVEYIQTVGGEVNGDTIKSSQSLVQKKIAPPFKECKSSQQKEKKDEKELSDKILQNLKEKIPNLVPTEKIEIKIVREASSIFATVRCPICMLHLRLSQDKRRFQQFSVFNFVRHIRTHFPTDHAETNAIQLRQDEIKPNT